MALPSFKCTRCNESFKFGDWFCKTGERHEIEPKTYYAHANALRTYVSEERMEMMETGAKRLIPAKMVEFVAGQYTTQDPEEQYALDKKQKEGAFISKDQWETLHFKAEDLLREKNKRLEEELRRVKEENSLLQQVKSERGVRG